MFGVIASAIRADIFGEAPLELVGFLAVRDPAGAQRINHRVDFFFGDVGWREGQEIAARLVA